MLQQTMENHCKEQPWQKNNVNAKLVKKRIFRKLGNPEYRFLKLSEDEQCILSYTQIYLTVLPEFDIAALCNTLITSYKPNMLSYKD